MSNIFPYFKMQKSIPVLKSEWQKMKHIYQIPLPQKCIKSVSKVLWSQTKVKILINATCYAITYRETKIIPVLLNRNIQHYIMLNISTDFISFHSYLITLSKVNFFKDVLNAAKVKSTLLYSQLKTKCELRYNHTFQM